RWRKTSPCDFHRPRMSKHSGQTNTSVKSMSGSKKSRTARLSAVIRERRLSVGVSWAGAVDVSRNVSISASKSSSFWSRVRYPLLSPATIVLCSVKRHVEVRRVIFGKKFWRTGGIGNEIYLAFELAGLQRLSDITIFDQGAIEYASSLQFFP